MTAQHLFLAAVTVGLTTLVTALVLTLVTPGGERKARSVVDVVIGGLFVAFVAAVYIALVGANLP